MNFVTCNEDCKHQLDGCCKLNSSQAIVNSTTKNGCSYFVKKTKAMAKNSAKEKSDML